jgi:hypothetical protein
MTRSTSETSRLRALKADPVALTLRWLLNELVRTGMIPSEAARSLADRPASNTLWSSPRRRSGLTDAPKDAS